MQHTVRNASCVCGQVRCEAVGAPILSAVCYCDDCQSGGRLLEELPDAARVLDVDGGTAVLVYRTDRFRCVAGETLLRAFTLKERAYTERFVATCCNTAMYLKFRPGHWVSVYRTRFEGDLPPIEMRSQIQFRKSETPFPDDAPRYRRFPLKLFGRLLWARWQMLVER
ncbi:MAG: hypothetical protein JXQ99_22925 [Hyphomicrobiaceae bacterium]